MVRLTSGNYPTSSVEKLFQKATLVDSKLNAFKPLGIAILSCLVDKKSVAEVKNSCKYIGIFSYWNKANMVLSGEIFEKRKLKIVSTVLMVLSKTTSYLSIIPPLLSSNPCLLTAVKVANVASRLGSGTSISLSSVIKGLEMYESKEERNWSNVFSMIGLAAIAYQIVVPMFITAPAVAAVASLLRNVTMGSLFAKDMYSILFAKKDKTSESLELNEEDSAFCEENKLPIEYEIQYPQGNR